MNQLYPDPVSDVDVYDAYQPDDPAAPLVRINMVTALDGHIVDAGGVSGSLGGEGDKLAFFAMRHHADALVVGASTVRAEGYGPMKIRSAWAKRRSAAGRDRPASIVVVTRSLDLDPTLTLFTAAVAPTIVLTTTDAPADRIDGLRAAGGVVIQTGEGDVDLKAGFRRLADDHGLTHLLVEGGPNLNGQVIGAGLAQEICVTLAPVLAGGTDGKRLVEGLSSAHDLRLSTVIENHGELLLTYRL
ncbi:hypothetical protein BH24ACT15_BH24ACT15_22510 [soil metagenome]